MHSNGNRRPRLTAEGCANYHALVDQCAAAAAAPPAPPPVAVGTVWTLCNRDLIR
jgi:hypothetical protein